MRRPKLLLEHGKFFFGAPLHSRRQQTRPLPHLSRVAFVKGSGSLCRTSVGAFPGSGVIVCQIEMRASPGTAEDQTVVRYFDNPGPDTYSALYREVLGSVIGYFRTRGCGVHLAEDLAQDVMLAVYRHSAELRDPKRFYGWLFQIARNRLLQFRRDTQKEVDLADMGDVAGPQRDPLAASEFAEWMSVLDVGEREVMMLRYIEGLKHHEIATVLEIPIGTVQWRVFQSTRKLAAHFGPPKEMKHHGA